MRLPGLTTPETATVFRLSVCLGLLVAIGMQFAGGPRVPVPPLDPNAARPRDDDANEFCTGAGCGGLAALHQPALPAGRLEVGGERVESELRRAALLGPLTPTSHLSPLTFLRPLLEAMAQVESGGNDLAVGDGGRARGPYQLWRGYWLDGCRQLGVRWSYDRAWSREYSERVIVAYWRRYCPRALWRGDWQTLARVHNGGPGGASSPRTVAYWRSVRAALEAQQ